jgi:hypothetical protein
MEKEKYKVPEFSGGKKSEEISEQTMKVISGITLERYAELLAKTIEAGEDESEILKIIEKDGIMASDWKRAKQGWSERMRDPADNGKTTALFMPLYESALERKYFEKEPCSLEEFTKIHCEITYRKDPNDLRKQINFKDVLKENGLTIAKWGLYNSFWTPRIAMPQYRKTFVEFVQKNSERILGISD